MRSEQQEQPKNSKQEQKTTQEKVVAKKAKDKDDAAELQMKRLAKRIFHGCGKKGYIKRNFLNKHKSGGSKSGDSSAGFEIDQLNWDSSQYLSNGRSYESGDINMNIGV